MINFPSKWLVSRLIITSSNRSKSSSLKSVPFLNFNQSPKATGTNLPLPELCCTFSLRACPKSSFALSTRLHAASTMTLQQNLRWWHTW